MDDSDFKDLYDLMRGNADAMLVLDLQGVYQHREFEEALEKLQEVRERYFASKTRVLRQKISEDDKGKSKEQASADRKTLRRQKKYQEVLDKIDELVEGLKPLAQRAKSKRQASAPASPATETVNVQNFSELTIDSDMPPLSLEEFLDEFTATPNVDLRRSLIDRCFKVMSIENREDVQPGELYFLETSSDSFLALVTSVNREGRVRLQSAINGKKLKSVSLTSLLNLGESGRAIHLGVLEREEPVEEASSSDIHDVPQLTIQTPSGINLPYDDDDDSIIGVGGSTQQQPPEPSLQESAETAKILDKGAFSQLADAVQRAGICPGADTITHVRDREFRKGNFQDALQAMESLYGKYTAAASSHAAQLRQEDANIAAGRIKMSPKELQAKRSRDNAKNQLIERARNRFSRVLDGLRVLLRTQQTASE